MRKYLSMFVAAILLFSAFFVISPLEGKAAPSGFVQVNDTEFEINGEPFYFAGTNNYYMHYKSNAMIDDVLEDAAAMGLKVLRVWGFHDGEGQEGYVMQPEPGVYDESGFERLDYTIMRAGELGIKLVIPFVNNWDDFGGMNQYVEWFGASSHDDFYTHPEIKQTYKDYIAYMLNRENTYTGVKYKDDPTIMTWELANEPRCASDTSGDTLVNWADEMSTYVKSLDPNHLVAVGDEGFFGIEGHSSYPYSDYEGVDWERLTSLPNVDYGTYHLYPDHWNTSAEWGTQWIRDHIQTGMEIGKPVVLEEFGIQSNRNQVYEEWTTAVEEEGGAGSQFWILTGIQDDGSLYPDYDGFRVTYPSDTADIFIEHASVMNSRSGSGSNNPPGDFSLTSPSDGAEGISTTPEFAWGNSFGADSYTLVVDDQQDFASPVIEQSGITANQYAITSELENDTTYFWKVIATNENGDTEALNNPFQFTTTSGSGAAHDLNVEAAVPSEDDKMTQYQLRITNNDSRELQNFTARIYVDISEVLAAGKTADDIVFETYWDSSASAAVSSLNPYSGDVYYYEIDWQDAALAQGENVEIHFSIHLNDWSQDWDGSNDFSRQGLTSGFSSTLNIPVFADGARVYGDIP